MISMVRLMKARIDLSLLKGRPWDNQIFQKKYWVFIWQKECRHGNQMGNQIDMESMINITDCIDPKSQIINSRYKRRSL